MHVHVHVHVAWACASFVRRVRHAPAVARCGGAAQMSPLAVFLTLLPTYLPTLPPPHAPTFLPVLPSYLPALYRCGSKETSSRSTRRSTTPTCHRRWRLSPSGNTSPAFALVLRRSQRRRIVPSTPSTTTCHECLSAVMLKAARSRLGSTLVSGRCSGGKERFRSTPDPHELRPGRGGPRSPLGPRPTCPVSHAGSPR